MRLKETYAFKQLSFFNKEVTEQEEKKQHGRIECPCPKMRFFHKDADKREDCFYKKYLDTNLE